MKLADVTAWLAGSQDYAQGAALYAQLGTRSVYQRLFSLPPSDYSRGVLVRELRNLVAPELPAQLPEPPAAAAPEPAPTVPGSDSPELRDVLQQLKAVRDERSHLHPQLTAPGLRQPKRYQLAGRIVALTDQEVELLALAAHVRQHGRRPGPVATAEVSDAGELRRRLQNLLCLRSKLKKQPARASDLARAEADIQLIRSKLTP